MLWWPALRQHKGGATIAIAESCTGGLAAHQLTNTPGSSEVFNLGVAAYGYQVKRDVLGVPESVFAHHGAVSQACAEGMATGIRRLADATYGLAITGIAGPGGGTATKPVGTVHFALASPIGMRHLQRRFPFDRERNKAISAHVALFLLWRELQTPAEDVADLLGGRWTDAK